MPGEHLPHGLEAEELLHQPPVASPRSLTRKARASSRGRVTAGGSGLGMGIPGGVHANLPGWIGWLEARPGPPDRKKPCFRGLGKQGEWPRLESNQRPAV